MEKAKQSSTPSGLQVLVEKYIFIIEKYSYDKTKGYEISLIKGWFSFGKSVINTTNLRSLKTLLSNTTYGIQLTIYDI